MFNKTIAMAAITVAMAVTLVVISSLVLVLLSIALHPETRHVWSLHLTYAMEDWTFQCSTGSCLWVWRPEPKTLNPECGGPPRIVAELRRHSGMGVSQYMKLFGTLGIHTALWRFSRLFSRIIQRFWGLGS